MFLGAALFAGVAVPAWILLLTGVGDSKFFSAARKWHVPEMVFGFLPAVITGFVLTAIPNWTGRTMLRVFGAAIDFSTNLVLGLAAMSWSGAYLLFALVYGPFLLRPSIEE